MSNLLIKFLLVEYFIIMGVCVWEAKFNMALYWIGAIILNYAILRGLK